MAAASPGRSPEGANWWKQKVPTVSRPVNAPQTHPEPTREFVCDFLHDNDDGSAR